MPAGERMYTGGYLRNAWYMAGWQQDFPGGAPHPCTLLGDRIVFYRGEDGRLAALEDRCCHRFAPLSLGRIEGNDLRCLYHGLKFTRGGECCEMPGHTSIPQAMRVRSYPVIERHGATFIWMGDAALADEAALPPFVGPDDPHWAMLPGRMDYDVHFRLIQDNLLDLSHIAWVHRDSFGGGNADTNRAWAEAELRVTPLAQGVRVERWMPGARTPPTQQPIVGPLCDALTSFDYLAPGYFLLTSNYYRPGAAGRAGANRPTEEPIFSSFTSQAVTPISDRRTCYFFCFGPWSREREAEKLKSVFLDLAYRAFGEDRDMLTAQQKTMDSDPTRAMRLFEVDRAPVLYQRLVDRLLAEEVTRSGTPH